jgi:putative multiple sugar transport system substrate-binding protein
MKTNKFFFISLILLSALLLTAYSPKTVNMVTMAASTPTPKPTPLPTPTKIPDVGPGGKIPLGIILPDSNSQISINAQKGLLKYLKSLGYSAQIAFSNNDTKKEITNLKGMIEKGIKVLIYCPVNSEKSAFVAEMAKKAGVQVIAYDRLVKYTDAVSYYVSFDNTKVGELQGQYLVDHADGTGIPLFLFAGPSYDTNAFSFFKGAWKVLQPKIADGTFVIANSSHATSFIDKAELLPEDIDSIFQQISFGNWNPEEARKMAKSQLKSIADDMKTNVFILAPIDVSARVISDVFRADKAVKSFLITGQDAESASISYIRSGRQSMTVYKDPRIPPKKAVDAALALLVGEKPEYTETIYNGKYEVPFLVSGIVVVDKSNVDTAIK